MKNLLLIHLLIFSGYAHSNDINSFDNKGGKFQLLSETADFSYPKQQIKCDGDNKDIWPKFYISGPGEQNKRVVYWVGFCENGKIGKVYSHQKGWFSATGNLAKAVEKNKNYQGAGWYTQESLSLD